MFDSDTVRLIASAPPLSGLDLTDLPKKLTNAYASLVSARVRLQHLAANAIVPDDIANIVDEMKRLAYANEAFVSVLDERENRAAAAFVAGTAHHITSMADKLRVQPLQASYLTLEGISPEVSATILFLIAESSADAAEMAKAIVVNSNDMVEAALLHAIVHLANGKFRKILEIDLPTSDQILEGDGSEQAVRALYFMLLQGVCALAARMLSVDVVGGIEPKNQFDEVKKLCVESIDVIAGEIAIVTNSIYPGPLHLASLLSSVSKDLFDSALVKTPTPQNINPGRWLDVLKTIAEHRPYLWRNHREAIASGYLEFGVSSAISFPTGAGKSTLAELKIATELLRGVKVVFLVPTLALVDQTAKALNVTFPNAEVLQERPEELIFDFNERTLPAISVMTPERCLAMLSFDREVFSRVGLLIFDECHLLHPRDMDRSRRAIDAMLCVLNFVDTAPNADLLFLSAMMRNTEEIAAWMETLTGRRCLALALTWKPTRQVRGCVVYSQDEIARLDMRLREGRVNAISKDAPKSLKRELNARPYGLFCLHQTWQSRNRNDYTLLSLLDHSVMLANGVTKKRQDWYLTPNGNQVAATIGTSTARQGLKTLIFAQTIPLVNSASKAISLSLGRQDCLLSEEEKYLYEVALDECGGATHLYIEVEAGERLISSSICHHGLLLSVERQLHESLFKRKDGVNAIVATSTLAQGMNLPSEIVIIGGDSRFDQEINGMEQLEAHELLNAAGRAGRAGDSAYGFVLVVPSKVVGLNNEQNSIHAHWTTLQNIFSQSDQCLTIDDPMTSLLDQIHTAAIDSPLSEMAIYMLRRLPVADSQNMNESDIPAQELLNRSFAAFRARQRGDQNWVNSRIEAAITLRHADPSISDRLTWADRLAAAAGVPVDIIRELGESLSGAFNFDVPMSIWYEWFIRWLSERPHIIPLLVRRESLEGLLGTAYKSLSDDHSRGQFASERIFPLLNRWMAGDTLAELERLFGTPEHLIKSCEKARSFVLKIVPELAYICGLPQQVFRALIAERSEVALVPTALEVLGSCVQAGLDSIEKLALRQHYRRRVNRRAIHRRFAMVESYLPASIPNERFNEVVTRIENAIHIAQMFGE